MIDIRFYENKSNGISKGFAIVSFASRESAEIAMPKFSQQIIDGSQKLTSMPGTKQNYELLKSKVSDGYYNVPKPRSENQQFQQNQDLTSAVQNILKNPQLLAQAAAAGTNSNSVGGNLHNIDEDTNQNFGGWGENTTQRNYHNNRNDSLLAEWQKRVNEIMEEAQDMAETTDVRRAVFKLMDCAEEIRQTELHRNQSKPLLDSLYDKKRALTAKYEWKKPSHNNHRQYGGRDRDSRASPEQHHQSYSRESRYRSSRRSRSRSPPARRQRSYSPPSNHHRSRY